MLVFPTRFGSKDRIQVLHHQTERREKGRTQGKGAFVNPKNACLGLLVGLLGASPAVAMISMCFDAADQRVDSGEREEHFSGTASVDVLADIPEGDNIVGWGLDLDWMRDVAIQVLDVRGRFG
jgi:hypothetical protein